MKIKPHTFDYNKKLNCRREDSASAVSLDYISL